MRILIALAGAPALLAVLVVVLLVSQPVGAASSLPNDPASIEPAAVRWRADQVIPASSMPGWVVSHDYEVPQGDLVQGSGAAVDNVRNRSVRGAHERVFDSLDGTYRLSTRVWECTTASRAAYRHTDNVPLTGRFPVGARAWVGRDDSQRRVFALEMSRGRTFVEMTLEVPPATDGGPTAVVAAAELADAAAAQAPVLRDAPDLRPSDTDRSEYLHYVLIALVLGYLLWFQVLVAVVAGVSDRGFRDHVRAWLARDPSEGRHHVADLPDVGDEIRARHRRHRRTVVVRSLVVGGLTVAVYEARLGIGILGSIGLLAAVAVILSGVDLLRERRRSRRTTGSAPSVGFSLGLLAASVCSVVLASGGALVVFFVAMSALLDPPDMSVQQKQGALLAYVVLGVGAFLLADVPMRLVRRVALAQASRGASTDPRREILFLRSFADDGLRVRVRRGAGGSTIERWSLRRREGFEQLLVLALRRLGPVVAVGEPETRLPPLGATRHYYGEEWRTEVDRMAQHSQLIVFTVGRSVGVTEEVTRVRSAGLLGKCLFVLPPLGSGEAKARLRVLSWALDIDPAVLTSADETGARLLAVQIGAHGRLVCWRAVGRTDIAYQVVLETASARTVSQPARLVHGVALPAPAVDDAAQQLLVTSANRAEASRIRWRTRRRRAWIPLYALSVIVALLTTTGGSPTDGVPVPGTARASAAVLWMGQRSDGQWLGLSTDAQHLVSLSAARASSVLALRERALTASIDRDTVLLSTTGPDSVVAVRTSGTATSVAWKAPMPSRPGHTAVVGNRVVVLLPQLDRAAVLDAGTGRQLGTVGLPRGPRDLAPVGATVAVAGEVDSTLTVVDPVRMRAVRTTSLPVSPFVLQASGPDLYVGSIADNAVLRIGVDGRVKARTDIPRFLGILGVDTAKVTAATYGDVPTVVTLRRADLGQLSATASPDTLDVAVGSGNTTWGAFTEERAVVSLP